MMQESASPRNARAAQIEDTERLLSRNTMADIAQRVEGMVQGGGITYVILSAWWRGELRWARNRVSLASDRRDYSLTLGRLVDDGYAAMQTNQLDDGALQALVHATEREARHGRKDPQYPSMPIATPELPYPSPAIWSETTYHVTAEQRGTVARVLTQDAEAQGMLSAGYIEMRGSERIRVTFGSRHEQSPAEAPSEIYNRHTQAQCSMTVRHPKGIGSGWAGLSGYDWRVIDAPVLAERALQKCVASLNPVAIEPGRYTVILEPQAVAQLVSRLMTKFSRHTAEDGRGPFALSYDRALQLWRTKLGLKIIDERISIGHDPMDPAQGVIPTPGLRPITWIDRGVLQTLDYDRMYALSNLNDNLGDLYRNGFAMSGGPTTLDEMIATTKRGVIVTRFSTLQELDNTSILTTGLTRDGLWLVENGTITRAIRNMRFTDSPLFVLNQVEQLGHPVPVFHPVDDGLAPWIVPPLKANDFSFVATIDAV